MNKNLLNRLLITKFFLISFLGVQAQKSCEEKPRKSCCYNQTEDMMMDSLLHLYDVDDKAAILDMVEVWKKQCPYNFSYSQLTMALIKLEKYGKDSLEVNALFFKQLLGLVEYRVFRDELSKQEMQEIDTNNSFYRRYRDYDLLLINWGKEIQKETNLNPPSDINKALNILVDNSRLFDSIRDSQSDSEISHAYHQAMREMKNKSLIHVGFNVGIWVPEGNMAILGNHPEIGAFLGLTKNRWGVAMDYGFRFSKSKNSYLVDTEDELYESNYFFGAYLGLKMGFELYRRTKSSIHLLTSMGGESIDIIEEGEGNAAGALGSFYYSAGTGYNHYINDYTYLGLEWGYNIVDYDNKRGTDLSGNTHSIRLKLGLRFNKMKELKIFGYDKKW